MFYLGLLSSPVRGTILANRLSARRMVRSETLVREAAARKFDENPWLKVPLRAALEHVPPLPRPGPEDPGPFSFASEQRVHRILAEAGFQSVVLEPRDFDLDIACGGGIEEALEAAMAHGPTSRALQDQGPEARAAVVTSISRVATLSTRYAGCACRGNLLVTANNA